MKQMRLLLAIAAGMLSTGCFQMATTVTVNGDASGTIAQRLLFTRAAVAQLQQFGSLANGSGRPYDPLSEDQARADAAKIGPGVTYVSSTPIDDATGQGRETIYAFTDISQLHVNQEPPAPGGMTIRGDGMSALKQNIAFAVTTLPNGNSLLTITTPQVDFGSAALGAAAGGPTQISPEQIAMAKQIFAGARLTIAVEPAGTLVRSSSPYVAGNRVTLLDVDFDQLMAGPVVDRLRSATSADEARAALKDLPGLKASFDPQITIEFTPGK